MVLKQYLLIFTFQGLHFKEIKKWHRRTLFACKQLRLSKREVHPPQKLIKKMQPQVKGMKNSIHRNCY